MTGRRKRGSRQRRGRSALRIAGILLLLAAAGHARAVGDAPPSPLAMLELLWQDTGTNMLFVDPSGRPARHVLDIVLTPIDADVTAFDLSVVFDIDGGDEVDFLGGHESVASPDPGYLLASESPDTLAGIVRGIDGTLEHDGLATVTLGTIAFVTNPGSVADDGDDIFIGLKDGDFILAGDVDLSDRLIKNGAQVKPAQVPEPGVAALLVAGLGSMWWAGRRRGSA